MARCVHPENKRPSVDCLPAELSGGQAKLYRHWPRFKSLRNPQILFNTTLISVLLKVAAFYEHSKTLTGLSSLLLCNTTVSTEHLNLFQSFDNKPHKLFSRTFHWDCFGLLRASCAVRCMPSTVSETGGCDWLSPRVPWKTCVFASVVHKHESARWDRPLHCAAPCSPTWTACFTYSYLKGPFSCQRAHIYSQESLLLWNKFSEKLLL